MNKATGIEAEVCADIARRQQLGIHKYGQTVAENPLPLDKWLQHLYEELLDGAIYAKRAAAELSPVIPNAADAFVELSALFAAAEVHMSNTEQARTAAVAVRKKIAAMALGRSVSK